MITEDLTPSDTAQLNRQYVKGLVTDIGGRTSHSAIVAWSMEIPAVVGTKTATEEIEVGSLVIIDGLDGNVIVNPDTLYIQTAPFVLVWFSYSRQKKGSSLIYLLWREFSEIKVLSKF